MSQSEDYLDGLLNSINKAKADVVNVQENAQKKQEELKEKRIQINPEDDFFAATGIESDLSQLSSSPSFLRRNFSEEDFLRELEEELANGKADSFIDAFEAEIDAEEKLFEESGEVPSAEETVNKLVNNIDDIVSNAQKQMEEDDLEGFNLQNAAVKESSDEENSSENTEESLDNFPLDLAMEEEKPIEEPGDEESLDVDAIQADVTSTDDEDSSDDLGLSLDDLVSDVEEDSLDDSMKEFMPDEMDALDAAEFGDEADLSGEGDLDLDSLLSDDDDLSDIESLLNGETGQSDIDENVEDAENPEDTEDSDAKGKKGKRKKKKEKKPAGEKKDGFLSKLLLIIFGPDDEEEDEAPKDTKLASKEGASDDEIFDALASGDSENAADANEEAGDKKKKKEKKEKPKKEPKPKKEKKPKPPKPKKEKKPKEPDNSPKIPFQIIVIFLLLSVSIIGVVLIGMNYMGIQRHMSQAIELYDAGDYISAYEKLNGLDLTDDDDILNRNRARVLADLQQCQNEYEAFISSELYDFALDSLIKGIGRYDKYRSEAEEYGILEEYDAYGNTMIDEINESFGLSKDEALNIFNQKNRHYYTIELRKVLIKLGLDEQ